MYIYLLKIKNYAIWWSFLVSLPPRFSGPFSCGRYLKKKKKKDPDCALQYLKTHNDICAKTVSMQSKKECPQDFIIVN